MWEREPVGENGRLRPKEHLMIIKSQTWLVSIFFSCHSNVIFFRCKHHDINIAGHCVKPDFV